MVYVECLLRRERGLRDRDTVLPNQREIHTFVLRNSILRKNTKSSASFGVEKPLSSPAVESLHCIVLLLGLLGEV